jgi:type I site-specific restriction endonuclease
MLHSLSLELFYNAYRYADALLSQVKDERALELIEQANLQRQLADTKAAIEKGREEIRSTEGRMDNTLKVRTSKHSEVATLSAPADVISRSRTFAAGFADAPAENDGRDPRTCRV